MKIKYILAANKQALANTCICFMTGCDDNTSVPIKLTTTKGKEIAVTPEIHNAVTRYRYKWFIYMIVGCYNSKGEKELKIDYAPMKDEYYQKDLVSYLNNRHGEFVRDLKSKNVNIQFVGWVAKISGKELTPEELFNLFENLGGWANNSQETKIC